MIATARNLCADIVILVQLRIFVQGRDMLENDYVLYWMQASQRADENVARSAGCRVTQVESEVVVPLELASEKKQLSPFDDSGEVFEVLAGAPLGVRENIRDCFSDLASRRVRVVHR
jgi:hypothetical protein